MNPPDEFLKHAVQCEQMAKNSHEIEKARLPGNGWQRDGVGVLKDLQAQQYIAMYRRRTGNPYRVGPET